MKTKPKGMFTILGTPDRVIVNGKEISSIKNIFLNVIDCYPRLVKTASLSRIGGELKLKVTTCEGVAV